MKSIKEKPLKVNKGKAAVRKIHNVPWEPANNSKEIEKLVEKLKAQRTKFEQQKDELKRKQKELVNLQQKCYSLFEQATLGYLNIDKNYRILEANNAVSKLLNINKKILVNSSFNLFIEKNYLEIFRQRINRIKTLGTKEQFEIKLKRKNNNSFWALIECTPNQREGLSFRINLSINDVTEHKRNQLIINEQALMLEEANDAIIGYDINYKITFWNGTAEKLYGFTAKEALGKYGRRLLRPEYFSVKRDELINRLNKVGHIESETFRTTKNGRKILVESHVVLLRNHKHEVAGFVAIDRDITQHKQSEEELRKTRDYLDNLFNYANAPIICWDPKRKITRFNHAFEKLTGYKAKEVIGRNLNMLFPEDTKAESLKKIKLTLTGKLETVEIPVIRKDGEVRIALWNSANVYAADGKTIEATIAQGQDITERKRSQETLYQQHEWLQITLSSIGDAVLAVDIKGKITLMNPVAEQLTGWKETEVIGNPINNVFKILNEKTRKEPEDIIKRVFKKGAIISLANNTVLISRKGKEIPIEDSAAPIKDNNGNIIGVVLVFHDVTEKRRAQEELRQTRDYLENLFNYANAPIICWDPELKITRFNHASEKMTGYTSKEVLGRDLSMLFSENTREDSLRKIESTLNGKWEVVEIPVQQKDGKERIALWNSANVYSADGKAIEATIAQGQDITERKYAEETLQKQREWLSITLSSIGDAVLAVDTSGRITLMNPIAEVLTGWAEKEALGSSVGKVFKIINADTLKESGDIVERVLKEKAIISLANRTVLISRNGIEIPIEDSAAPIKDNNGNIIGAVFVFHDVTAKRQAQEELRRTRDYLENLFNYANAPIICWNSELKITRFNHAFEKMTGYAADEVLGKDLSILFSEVTREESLRKIENTLNGKWEVVEIPVRQKDGNERIALWNSANVYAADGKTIEATIAQGQDITERKKTENELQENKEQLLRANALTEAVTLGTKVLIATIDNDFRYTFFNQEHHKQLKLLTGKDTFIGMSLKDVLADMPGELEKSVNIWNRALNGETVVQTLEFGDPGKYSRWYNTRHTPIRDADGNIVGAGEVTTDVTEFIKMQEALRESESKFRTIIETSNEGILTATPDGIFTYVNQRMADMLGYSIDEIIGKAGTDFAFEVEMTQVIQSRQKLGKGESLSGEFKFRRKDGSLLWSMFNSSPIFNEKGEHVANIAMHTDITEQKKAEEALRESEQRLRFHFENSPLAVVEWNADFVVTQWSVEAEHIFGWKKEEVLGKRIDSLNMILIDDIPIVTHSMERLTSGKESTVISSKRNYTKSGNVIECIWYNSVLLDKNGKMLSVMSLVDDITERKMVQEKIKQAAHRWQITFDSIPDMVSIQDIDFRLISVNKAYERIFNQSKEELIGKRCYEVVHNSTCHVKNCPHAETLKTKKIVTHEIYEPLLGIYLEATTSPLFDENNKFVGSVHVAKNITERKRAEAELREREENMRAILDATKESIFMFDKKGTIVSANATAAKRLKHTLPEIIGHPFPEFMTQKLANERWNYLNKVFESAQPLQVEDERDGIIFQHIFYPVYENEKVARVVTYSQDVSVSRRREEQLKKLNLTLNALRHNGDAILYATDEESYMQEVCNIIMQDCGYAMIWIGFAEDDEHKTIRPVVSAGFEEGYLSTLNITWADTERGRGPTGTAVRTGKPCFCNNMLTDPKFKPWRAEAIKRGYASSVALPLKTTEKVFGVITIYSSQPDSFLPDEVNLLSELAEDFTYGLSVVKLRASHAVAVEELKKHRDHLEELVDQRTTELLTANEILKEAQEVAHIGNWRLDLATNYLEWSDEVYKIFGIEHGSFGASLESFLNLIHPDDRSFVVEVFGNSVNNKTFYNIDHKIIRPDGEIRIVHEQCVTHYDENEQPLYSIGVVQDITELKKIEYEIELHKTNLEGLVKTRTEELNVANRKLRDEIEKEKQVEMLLKNSLDKEKELNELKSRFISTTSHEFRTPLASILSSMQLIQRYRKKWNDEKLEDQFLRIKTSIFNLTSLLDDILTISRADSGRIIFKPQKLDLQKYCMELYEEVKHKATEKHKFVFNFSAKKKEFTLDPKLVRFIIVNLLSNAFKYSPEGGKVILNVSAKPNELQFSVKDEGIGICAEDKLQLFKPFFRAKNTIDIEGTGLGLSIVQRAVLMHNGKIKFHSTEGKGTRFIVKIPVE